MKCLWPFNHISIDTYGYVRPCCAWELWDVKTKPFNINQNKLSDYFKSESFLKLIDSMNKNQFGEGCRDCAEHEKKNIHSMKDESFHDYEYRNTFLVQDMEIKFGNLCNQGCVMCSPGNSSMLENELIKNLKKQNIELKEKVLNYHTNHQIQSGIKISPWFENEERFNEVVEMASRCRIVRFTGGEPTVNNNILNFLDILKNLNKNVDIKITTNGHTFNQKLIDVLSNFKKVIIEVSIDGYKEVQEYIRWPSKWGNIENNVVKMIGMANTSVRLNCTVQVLNVGEIHELFDWALSKDINFINTYPVWSPNYFRPCLASKQRKEKFLSNIEKYKDNQKISYEHLLDIAKTFSVLPDRASLEKLTNYLKWIDNVRKTDYQQIVRI